MEIYIKNTSYLRQKPTFDVNLQQKYHSLDNSSGMFMRLQKGSNLLHNAEY